MKYLTSNQLVRVAAACVIIAGCSEPGKVPTPAKSSLSSDVKAAPAPAAPAADAPSQEAAPAPATMTEADSGTSGGAAVADPAPAPQDMTAPTPPAEDPAVTQLINDCGGAKIIKAAPTDTIFSEDMKAIGFTAPPQFGVTAHLGASLSIAATPSQTKEQVKVDVKSLDGLFALFGIGQAKDQAAQNSGTMTYTSVAFSALPQLGDHNPDWRGIACSVLASTDLDSHMGSNTTTVTFDPPLPTSVQPAAAQSRIETEIGDKKVFSNIKASIVKTNHPLLKDMTSVTGTVTITKVSPNVTVKEDNGTVHNISAESAYLLTYDFKSPAITNALGMIPSVTVYLKNSTHTMMANTADTSAVGGAKVTFLAP